MTCRPLLSLCAGAMLVTAMPDNAAAQIAGRTWHIASVDGAPVQDTARTRFVVGTDGILNTSIGCNSMRASFAVSGTTVTIGPLAGTRMACSPDLMDLEMRYSRALAEAKSFAFDGPALRLLSAQGAVLVLLRE